MHFLFNPLKTESVVSIHISLIHLCLLIIYVYLIYLHSQLPNGELSGSDGLLFAAYISHINGLAKIEATPDVNWHNYHSHTLLATARNEIDIGVHLYTQMTLNSEWAEGGLTYALTQTCLVVPWQHEKYITQVMKFTAPLGCVFLLTTLICFTLVWQLCSHDGWTGFYMALAAYFNQALDDRIYRELHTAYKYIYLGVLLCTFILWNVRNAYLSAIMSTNHQGPQIHTVQDFLRTPLRVMLTDTEAAMYFTHSMLPEELKDRLVVVTFETLMQHIGSLNTSYAYCITTSQWQMLKMHERKLTFTIFRRASPKLCTPKYVKLFPVRRNSPFRGHFQLFYSTVRSYGLHQKWECDGYIMARHLGLRKFNLNDPCPIAPLTIADFHQTIYMYFIAIGVSILCLLFEIAWKQWGELIASRVKRYFWK